MQFQILCDGCCDLTATERRGSVYRKVPAAVSVGERTFADDGDFRPAALLDALTRGAEARVEFPDAQAYLAAMDPLAEAIYLVTASPALGGQYETASYARRLLLYRKPERQIHVFNTRSGGLGQLLAARRISQLHRSGCSFRQTVERVESDILAASMFFLPGEPEVLRKGGLVPPKRLPERPKWVCAMGLDGSVTRLASAMTEQGAEKKLLEALQSRDTTGKVCLLAHTGCPDRARRVSQQLLRAARFSQIITTETSPISTLLLRTGLAIAF